MSCNIVLIFLSSNILLLTFCPQNDRALGIDLFQRCIETQMHANLNCSIEPNVGRGKSFIGS